MDRLRLTYVVMSPPVPAKNGYSVRTQTLGQSLKKLTDFRYLVLDTGSDDAAEAATKNEFRADFVNADSLSFSRRALSQARAVLHNRNRWLEKFAHGHAAAAVRQAFSDHKPDIVVAGSLAFWPLLRQFGVPPDRIVVDHHNVETENYARMAANQSGARQLLSKLDIRAFARAERDCRSALDQWAVSEGDASTLRAILDRPVQVLPNIARSTMFDVVVRGYLEDAPATVGFLGSYGYYPNVEAVQEMIKIVPDIRSRVGALNAVATGSGAADWLQRDAAAAGIDMPGFVDDLSEVAAQFSLLLAPLRSGGGTKLKLIEGCAIGLPIVTTTVGAEGLPIEDEGFGVVVDERDAMAEVAAQLLRDRPRLKAMGERAKAWAWANASESAITKRLAERMRAYEARLSNVR